MPEHGEERLPVRARLHLLAAPTLRLAGARINLRQKPMHRLGTEKEPGGRGPFVYARPQVEREARVFRTRSRPDHLDEWCPVTLSRINGCKRLDERALAAAVLAYEERDPRRDVEAALGDELRDRRDCEWPRPRVRRTRGARGPVDTFDVAGFHGRAQASRIAAATLMDASGTSNRTPRTPGRFRRSPSAAPRIGS